MDFDLRQWLLILGPIFIVGVLLHGYFRMRSGQNEIKMKLDKSFVSKPGEDHSGDEISMFKAELPNGGARVIGPEAGAIIPDDDVPVLMESVELPSISATSSVELSEPEPEREPDVIAEPLSEPASELEESSVNEAPAKAPPARKAPEIDEDQSDEEAVGSIQKPEKFVVIYVLALDESFPRPAPGGTSARRRNDLWRDGHLSPAG